VVTPISPPPDAEDKLRDIRVIADAALSYLGAEDFLAELLGRVKESLDADTAAVLLLDRSSRQLVATAASGLEEEVRQGVRIPVGRGFAGRIAAEARPVILDRVDHTNVLNPILLEKGIRSVIGVPLLVNGTVIGVLHVGSLSSRVFTSDDETLLQLAAERAALAVQSLRSRGDRAAAAALQQSLLPPELPAVPGLEIAARYVPGDGRVGGDWYDVFTLPTGEVCVVMGDVAGSGLQAAVIMAACAAPCAHTRWKPATPPRCWAGWTGKFSTAKPTPWRPCRTPWPTLLPGSCVSRRRAISRPSWGPRAGIRPWLRSPSASRSASPITRPGRPPLCASRPGQSSACSPTGW
jgi:putative methionine-R-sulfoxide reductase with GAF domain